MKYLTSPLDSGHKREKFLCGKSLLDNYFWHQAKQDIKRKLSVCFVLSDNDPGIVSGYYTLSGSSISQNFIPESFAKLLPKAYTTLPVILLGRLAVDKKFQGKGIGKILLIDALKRCADISETLGAFAVIVDPLDMDAEVFYQKYGFIKLPDSGKMFLPMKTIINIFKKDAD